MGEGATKQRIYEAKAPAEMPGLVEGRIVHYVLANGGHRAAIVARNWHTPAGTCNLQVFLDGLNDKEVGGGISGTGWATSVVYSAEPKPETWHWIEKA